MLIAGEASGDLHASRLIDELKKNDAAADFRFFGGDLMAARAGEVIRRLPSIFRNLRRARELLIEYRPDVLILVDFPGFNLKLARFASRHGFRVDYYISPKIWAWKEWRLRSIRRYVSNIYSILPFEVDFYRRRGYDHVTYVGNPSVEEIDYAMGHIAPLKHFLERQGISDPRPMIASCPDRAAARYAIISR